MSVMTNQVGRRCALAVVMMLAAFALAACGGNKNLRDGEDLPAAGMDGGGDMNGGGDMDTANQLAMGQIQFVVQSLLGLNQDENSVRSQALIIGCARAPVTPGNTPGRGAGLSHRRGFATLAAFGAAWGAVFGESYLCLWTSVYGVITSTFISM